MTKFLASLAVASAMLTAPAFAAPTTHIGTPATVAHHHKHHHRAPMAAKKMKHKTMKSSHSMKAMHAKSK